MKHKFKAFSLSLVIALVVFLGPRHPGGAIQLNLADRFSRTTDTAVGVAQREAMASMVGNPIRLRLLLMSDCGEELAFEDQLNCVLSQLSHPGLWLR